MNYQLEKLFQRYKLSEKDRYDFRQIYTLLSPQKKVRVLENFIPIMLSIESLREKLYIEHDILFGETLDRIEYKLEVIQNNLNDKQVESQS